jgi:hypothetical protein
MVGLMEMKVFRQSTTQSWLEAPRASYSRLPDPSDRPEESGRHNVSGRYNSSFLIGFVGCIQHLCAKRGRPSPPRCS